MDRRQRKTRDAIFKAFTELLSKKDFSAITVGEIIECADVGRATFYAHFETKEFLLKELCEELFCHLFDSMKGEHSHHHIFNCNAPDSAFLHLFEHLENNDNKILDLLSGENNGLFLQYFKKDLLHLIYSQLDNLKTEKHKGLPQEFLANHIASTFVETVKWWVDNGKQESCSQITDYFFTVI
ncbi:MAG: TetR/AcrR family transcriptional regulator [Clostridia bacterium]|nr:TetR/AcrR family transcriptional regulator [Clostridia bacterium]